MNRFPHLTILAVLLLALTPTAAAAWTTSVSVPASFRPERTVTFSYTATSNSATDLPLQWRIALFTCQDTDADTWCEFTDANRVDHGERTMSIVGSGTQTVSWNVNLNSQEGAYRYHFNTGCLNNPCTGSFQPGGANNRTGTFQLAYANTWTRQVLTTDPTSAGATQTVTYRMTSTSVDDRDLTGTAELYSKPPAAPEASQGAKTYLANANTVANVQWPNVPFPTIGMHDLRVADTNAADASLSVTVRGVHLHAVQPRLSYTAGARFSLYFTLEGHGAAPDPQGIVDDIQLSVKNGAYVIATVTLRTDAMGRAYANVTTAEDHDTLTWTAQTAGTWLGIAYDLAQAGVVELTDPTELARNVSMIRENLSEVQLKGVHLDEVGARNVWLSSVRAAGYALAVVLLVLLVVVISSRM